MNTMFLRTCLLLISVLFLQACGQGDEQGFLEAVAVNKQQITSLSVVSDGGSERVRVTETQGFTAIANIQGGETSDITSKVTWSSSDPSIVTINSSGVARGIADGTVEIIASYSDLSASTSLKSSSADIESIAVMNPNSSLSLCDTASLPLKATASYSDGDTDDVTDKVTWTSSDDATVFVGDDDLSGASDGLRSDKGVISSLSTGNAVIQASQDNITGSVTIDVTDDIDNGSISVTAPSKLYANESYTFSATASYGGDSSDRRDITNNLSWSSSDTDSLSFTESANPANALAAATGVTVTAVCAPNDSAVDEQASVSVDIDAARTIVDVVVKYGDSYIGEDDQISANTSDTDIQLELYLEYSDGSYSATDLASDDDTTWTFLNSDDEESNIDDDGLVTIDGEGLNQYRVRHVIGTQGYEIEFYINVEN